MSDVRFATNDGQTIIATSLGTTRLGDGGGIWRSSDGGSTWQNVAPPPTGPSCRAQYSAWGISAIPGNGDVFVGTDCGVAVSHTWGADWTHVVPDPTTGTVWAVTARAAGLQPSTVDLCASNGHYRSTDGGSTWTSFSAALSGCPAGGVHAIASAPGFPNILFAAVAGAPFTDGSCGSSGTNPLPSTILNESDDGGNTWTTISARQCTSRQPWAATHPSSDGNPTDFDLYFGTGLQVYRQTCPQNGGAGLHCSQSAWSGVSVDHADQNGLAFSTSSNCAAFMVSDGGVHTTSDCGGSWTITGGGNGGYDALQIYEVDGEVLPDHTDLYFGTQDNSIWASADSGTTWPNSVCCEGFFLQVPQASQSEQRVTGVACSGCFNFGAAPAHFDGVDPQNPPRWSNPPDLLLAIPSSSRPASTCSGVRTIHQTWTCICSTPIPTTPGTRCRVQRSRRVNGGGSM